MAKARSLQAHLSDVEANDHKLHVLRAVTLQHQAGLPVQAPTVGLLVVLHQCQQLVVEVRGVDAKLGPSAERGKVL
eukprot:scaffold293340_cov43-Prasinocladus_malaysianus.AAC.1